MRQRIDQRAVVGAVAGGLNNDIAREAEVVAQRKQLLPCRHRTACTCARARRGTARPGRTRGSGRRRRRAEAGSGACWGWRTSRANPLVLVNSMSLSISRCSAGRPCRAARASRTCPVPAAGGQLRALVALEVFALLRGVGNLHRDGSGHDHDAVVVGHHHIARVDSAPAQITGMFTEPSVALTVPLALIALLHTGKPIAVRSFTSRTPPSITSP